MSNNKKIKIGLTIWSVSIMLATLLINSRFLSALAFMISFAVFVWLWITFKEEEDERHN